MNNDAWIWPSPHEVDEQEMELLRTAIGERDWSHTSMCERFEQEFSTFLGAKRALLVPSGTAAVYLALVSAGIEKGQEVIVPGITWPSVVYAIVLAGGIPRTADISEDSLCLTGETVESAARPSTFAVLATHLFGSQCDMAGICEVARRLDVLVIEDAAQSVGSVQGDRSCGTWGAVGAFSLNDRKVLACGEGGCVVTNSEEIYEELKMLQLIQPTRFQVPGSLPGTYKISEFQAAVALGQLAKLPNRLSTMETNAQLLTEILSTCEGLVPQSQPEAVTRQSYYNYCFHVVGADSEVFRRRLSDELGLSVSRPYPDLATISDLRPTRNTLPSSVRRALSIRHPRCEIALERTLRLPHYVLKSAQRDIERLGEAMLSCYLASRDSNV